MPVCVSNPSTSRHGISFIQSGTYELHGSRRRSAPLFTVRKPPAASLRFDTMPAGNARVIAVA